MTTPNSVTVVQETVRIVSVGTQGPAGPAGDAGSQFVYTQASDSASWTVNHNLGHRPQVTLLTVGGSEFFADITHNSVNQLTVTLKTALAGSAICT